MKSFSHSESALISSPGWCPHQTEIYSSILLFEISIVGEDTNNGGGLFQFRKFGIWKVSINFYQFPSISTVLNFKLKTPDSSASAIQKVRWKVRVLHLGMKCFPARVYTAYDVP